MINTDKADPVIGEVLDQLARSRMSKGVNALMGTVSHMLSNFRKFAVKVAYDGEHFVVEASAPPFKPGTMASRNFIVALRGSMDSLRKNVDPEGVLVALDEAAFDAAIEEIEDDLC